MDSRFLEELEDKINCAVDLINRLKDSKIVLEKDNESLRHQLGNLHGKLASLERENSQRAEDSHAARVSIDVTMIKKRLKSLAGKLAALEESWN